MEKNLHGLGRHHFGVHTAVPEQKSDLMDTAERGDTHALLLLIGRKMGIEIWAQTQTQTHAQHSHTHTKPQTTKKKAIIDTRRHWDGNGLYSPPGANLVHLAHLFRSFTKQAFSAGIFFFFLFISFLFFGPFISLVLSGLELRAQSYLDASAAIWLSCISLFTCKEEEFSILFWARDNGHKTLQLAVQRHGKCHLGN